MKPIKILTMIAVALLAAAPWPALAEPASEQNRDYTEIKGGYYYPSERIHLSQFSGTDFDKKKGFDGEIAFGHNYGPYLGTEFGIGYFKDRRFPAVGTGRTTLDAVPVLLSAKLFLPIGPIEPYAEAGVGAYFSGSTEGGVGGASRARKVAVGPHVGAGVNINFSDKMYLGVEGRYRRVRPDFDGQRVRLDGYTATVNLGFRY